MWPKLLCSGSAGGARLTFNVVGHGKDSERESKELELEFFQQVKDELVVHPAALYAETGSEFSANDFSASDEGSESAAKVMFWEQQQQLIFLTVIASSNRGVR